ncbi:MAG TPA: pyridoxal phosphate-dependent aminotransferase [Anaerolineae bacterium]|nr:pyridoxal phosphate-dependent aminotransferase [Anaerolineae bacterium]HQI84382.1 pyridoxal phosphate-dependent aminotransferase [Anaerolineae bacterium]
MIALSDRTRLIAPSMTFAIDAKAKALAEQGIDVCNFGVGEPDFITPANVREAAKAALDAGQTKYSQTAGLPRLRALVAEKLNRENNLPYTREQVMISTGGKQALYNVMLAILGPGDEALIPIPYWVSYSEIVKLTGATPVFLPTSEATEFRITPEQLRDAITPRTRMLLLNSPSNPTGSVYTPEEIAALAEVIVAHGIAVVSDEIYEKLIYDGLRHLSIGSLGEDIFNLTLTCNGFSKAYAATGWRLGYAAGPKHVIEAAIDIQSHTTSGPNTFAQYGAIAALEESQESIEMMRATFERRRDLMYAGVSTIPGLVSPKPHGAFYLFPNISATGLDSITFCARLLEQEHLALVPGIAFGMDTNVRLSYAADTETIEKGLERLARFMQSL